MVHIVKLGLLTGLRRTEIAALRKAEVELCGPSPLLTIPRGRAKNRNAHRVPLSPAAVEVLSAAINASTDSDYVFPTAGGGTHVTPRSVSKAIERARQDLGISDVTMHDLRRTVGTAMSRFGVPREVRERVLNHGGKRKGSITDGVYNNYSYDDEKRAALELWADALDAILGKGPAEIDSYTARLAKLKGGDLIKVT
jgi:integrase